MLKILRILLLGWPSLLLADPVSDAVASLERLQMQWLAQQQKPDVKIEPFATDGCSGGLSDAWYYMAQQLPAFKSHWGGQPPWEACCVSHDRAYWQGETQQGYEKRLQADQALKTCVIQTGVDNSQRLADKFQRPQQDIEALFNVAAEMMYLAVRIGGKPCSLLPWRWGYGWPHCSMESHTLND